MKAKDFEQLFIAVRLGATVNLYSKAIDASETAIKICTKGGNNHVIAVVRYEPFTGCTCCKCFDAYPEGLVITKQNGTFAIPWDSIDELGTERIFRNVPRKAERPEEDPHATE